MIVFPVSVGFLIVLMLAAHVQSVKFQNLREPELPYILNLIALPLSFLVVSNVCAS
jgi:hypothetical protein